MSPDMADPFSWFPEPSASPLHLVSASLGKLGDFTLSGVILMTSGVLAANFVSVRVLCACVHVSDAFAWFPGLCDSSGCNLELAPVSMTYTIILRYSNASLCVYKPFVSHL